MHTCPRPPSAAAASARLRRHRDSTFCIVLLAAWRIHMCDMTLTRAWRDSFKRYIAMTLRWYILHHIMRGHDTFMCVTWHIHMCDMTHVRAWHDSVQHWIWTILRLCVVHHMMRDMTQSHVWHDSCTWVTWHIYVSHMHTRTRESTHARKSETARYLHGLYIMYIIHKYMYTYTHPRPNTSKSTRWRGQPRVRGNM